MLAVLDSRDPAYLDEVPSDIEYIDLGSRRTRYSLIALLRLVWTKRPAVVFSAIAHLNLAVAMLRPLLPKSVRIIARETAVVSDTLAQLRMPRLWALAYRTIYPRFDTVVCQSQAMKNELVGKFKLPEEKTRVIYNPIDLARVSTLASQDIGLPEYPRGESEDPLLIVAAGRLTEVKGFDLLINALAILNNPCHRLILLGDGPLRRELTSLAEELGIGSRINFVGFQRNPYPYFAKASLFVLSSRSEAFPNVVLEALACGAPVIATPASAAIVELLSDQPNCAVAEAVSAAALAKAIAEFSPRQVARVSHSLWKYSPEQACAQYDALLADLAER